MKRKIIIFGLLCINIQHSANAQTMGKPVAKMLSKKEVKELISSGMAVYDSVQSDKDNLNTYILKDGKVLYVRDDGKGALWESLEQIEHIDEVDKMSISVLNLEGWLNDHSNIETMVSASLQLLSKAANKKIDFSEQSLNLVSKMRIKSVVEQKEIFYAILLYSCGYYVHHYGGTLSKEKRHDGTYEPIILADRNRSYAPYAEYLKNFSQIPHVNLKESIELEKIKYNLRKE